MANTMEWKDICDEQPKPLSYLLLYGKHKSTGIYQYAIGFVDNDNNIKQFGKPIVIAKWCEISQPVL